MCDNFFRQAAVNGRLGRIWQRFDCCFTLQFTLGYFNGSWDKADDLSFGFGGKILQSDPAGEPIRVMNTETAETLRALLVSVVEEGTGYRAANRYCGAGGKTASAQTGRYQEGEEIVHAWFGGFFPAGEPKYVLVVFQEGGRAGGQTPASVFRAISEAVYCTENPGPADYGG